jgi:hypothetical protein
MRTLTILTFAAFISVPTFVAAQSMTAQQYHKEKGPCACPEDKDKAGNKCGRRSAFCESVNHERGNEPGLGPKRSIRQSAVPSIRWSDAASHARGELAGWRDGSR